MVQLIGMGALAVMALLVPKAAVFGKVHEQQIFV
jgi:hypothetical protein